jgi:hypothetical protein
MRPKFRETSAWDTDIVVCDRTPRDIVSRDVVKSATNPAPEGQPNIAQRFSAGKAAIKDQVPEGRPNPKRGFSRSSTGRKLQRGPTNVRTPQTAAIPMAARKAAPINRPDIVLLLQPWSTAISQTKNSTIAPEARSFVHIAHSSGTSLPSKPTRRKGRQSHHAVTPALPSNSRTLSSRAK